MLLYIYIYNKHIQFVYVGESALIIFPSLFLPASCLILEKHKKICTLSSLLGMPGSIPSCVHKACAPGMSEAVTLQAGDRFQAPLA